jgi:enoyl-CoA hydratase
LGGRHVRVERSDEVAIVRLDRPPANALELECVAELSSTFAALEEDDRIAAVVLTGTGAFFSGGLDLKEIPGYCREQQQELLVALNHLVASVYGFPLPVIGAANGHAVAGGLVCLLLCDRRLGTRESATFGLTEVRAGIPFPASVLEVLAAELAPTDLRRLVLGGATFTAEDALAMGILDEIVPSGDLNVRAFSAARTLASLPREGFARIKRQIRGETLVRLQDVRDTDPLMRHWLA